MVARLVTLTLAMPPSARRTTAAEVSSTSTSWVNRSTAAQTSRGSASRLNAASMAWMPRVISGPPHSPFQVPRHPPAER